MRCYFCLNERAPSDEHVFPLALGGTLHCYRVCEPCNSRLGREVDIRLIDHIACQIKRAELQLPGNSGSVPDPLISMAATSVLKEEPAKQIELRSDGKGGYVAKHRYHVAERTDEDGTVTKIITIDAGQPQQVLKIIDRERKRAGARPLTAEERKEIEDKLPDAVQTIANPELKANVKVDLIEYQRGILKIAYELACMWLGDAYLDCPTGARLRALVDAPAADIAKDDFVKITGGQHPRTQGWGETSNDHIAFVQIENGFALLAIKIFDVFSAAFVIALPTDKVIPPNWKGMFVSINPVTGVIVQSTFIEAVTARTKRAKDQRSR